MPSFRSLISLALTIVLLSSGGVSGQEGNLKAIKDLCEKAGDLSKEKKFNEASKLLSEAINLDPNNPLPWNVKGNQLFELDLYNEAVLYFDKQIALAPTDGNGWYCKGFALEHLGKNEDAINCYDKAIELNKNTKDDAGKKAKENLETKMKKK